MLPIPRLVRALLGGSGGCDPLAYSGLPHGVPTFRPQPRQRGVGSRREPAALRSPLIRDALVAISPVGVVKDHATVQTRCWHPGRRRPPDSSWPSPEPIPPGASVVLGDRGGNAV